MNAVRVEGLDPAAGTPVIGDVFDWDAVNNECGAAVNISDRNISSADRAVERGEVYLRKVKSSLTRAVLRTPVNCAQQLYDVISVTDKRAGIDAEAMRVLGITISYNPLRGEYEQTMVLGRMEQG